MLVSLDTLHTAAIRLCQSEIYIQTGIQVELILEVVSVGELFILWY